MPLDRRELPDTPRVGFGAGIAAVFGGFAFLARRPRTWPFAAVPGVIWTILFGLVVYALNKWLSPWVGSLLPEPNGPVGTIAVRTLETFVTVAAAFAGALLAGILAPPLSAPALEHIVEHVERDFDLPPKPHVGFFREIGYGLQAQLVGTTFAMPALLGLWLLGVLVPPLGVALLAPHYLVIALALAWNLFDYPLTLRGVPARERLALMRENWRATLGFGLGFALVFVFPCTAVILLPAAVAGATRLVSTILGGRRR